MARMVLSYRDFSREISTVEMLIAEPSAGGLDFDDVIADMAELIAALGDVTVGVLARESLVIVEDAEVADASAGAYRELGLRVFWADTTAETVGHFTIPCPDPAGAWQQLGTDLVDVSDTDIAALITAINANVYSPAGNLVNVSRIVTVGRRN